MNTRVGGRYQIVRELAAGGMGRVFQAIDLETGRPVAVKIMIAPEGDVLGALLRFQQEGAVVASLKHPNIVDVFGAYFEGQSAGIVMELLEGSSLADILQSGPIALGRAKHLAHQIAVALSYAHERGVVHRDIKPSNIFVVGEDQVKVTDFGIARVLRSGSTLKTATGLTLGTPLYMAPEQIEGQSVDGLADVYSLGALLFHMVTGRPPFLGDDTLAVAFAHVHKAPPEPCEIAPEIPEDWNALILRALAKHPTERFASAAEMAEAIEQLSELPRDAQAQTPGRQPEETKDALVRADTLRAIVRPASEAPAGLDAAERRPGPDGRTPAPPEQAGPPSLLARLTKQQLAILAAAAIVLIAIAAFLIGRTLGSGPTPSVLPTSTPIPTTPPTSAPTPTITPAPTPTPHPVSPGNGGTQPPPPPRVPANSAAVLNESLTGPSSTTLRTSSNRQNVTLGFVGGHYQIGVTGASFLNQHDYVVNVGPRVRADSDVSIAVRAVGAVSAPAVSIRCRDTIPVSSGHETGYAFYLYPHTGRFLLLRFNSNGSYTDLRHGHSPAAHTGSAWNTIELRCNRSDLTGSINGRVVAFGVDHHLFSGTDGIGLGASANGTKSVTAQFANLLLTRPKLRRRDDLAGPSGGLFSAASYSHNTVQRFVNGSYLVSVHDQSFLQKKYHQVFANGVGIQTDVTLAIDARIAPDATGRVTYLDCRYTYFTAGSNAYVVQIAPASRRYTLYREAGGRYTILRTGTSPAFAAQANAWNRLQLSCVGPSISVEINGQTVASATDSTFGSGKIAIGVGTNDNSIATVDVYFRRALVSSW